MKTCYYELLEVANTASDTELRKAFRKKALQLHPDKNPDDVEGANARFSLVRAAYEVLSDPQERAWYDSHKSQILREDDEVYAEADEPLMVIPSISIAELLRYFNPAYFTKVDDSLAGFFNVAGRLFQRLASEEVAHAKYQGLQLFYNYKDDANDVNAIDDSYLLFPRFGNSHSDYPSQVKEFYNAWNKFQTVKTFSWVDEYRYSMAPDRRTRRLMEKENKKLRDSARKEYNETVRKFVSFIRKRDPRVKEGQEKLEAARKRQQREANAKQAKEAELQKMAEDNAFEPQEWQKFSLEELEELEEMFKQEYNVQSDDDTSDSEYDEFKDDLGDNWFECVVCDKVFKSQKQFDVHENSKKHLQMVQLLREEMLREGVELGIDDEVDSDLDFETASSGNEDDDSKEKDSSVSQAAEDGPQMDATPEDIHETVDDFSSYAVDDDVENDVSLEKPKDATPPSSKKKAKQKPKSTQHSPEPESNKNHLEEELSKYVKGMSIDNDLDDDSWDTSKKKKKKDSKKKTSNGSKAPSGADARSVSEDLVPASGEKCAVCKEIFSSRNKLFAHVNSTGHAAPTKSTKSKKKNKKR